MAIENFRILIPTNRSKFLKQICKFYQKQNLKVTVVHDFKMNKVMFRKKNIKFLYLNQPISERIVYALKRIDEKYVCIMGDDDFVFKDSIKKCVDFLEKNKNYTDAQGLHHRFKIKNNKFITFPSTIKSMMKHKEDSSSVKRRIFHSFTNKFIDKFYTVMRRKDLYNIAITSIPSQKYSHQSLEFYWIVCCCLMGKSKIFDTIHCFRRDHNFYPSKLKNIKMFEDCLDDNRFKVIFYNCLKRFKNKSKIKEFISFKLLFFILDILKYKVKIIGRFKIFRKLLNILKFLNDKKLNKDYIKLKKKEIYKYNFIKNITL